MKKVRSSVIKNQTIKSKKIKQNNKVHIELSKIASRKIFVNRKFSNKIQFDYLLYLLSSKRPDSISMGESKITEKYVDKWKRKSSKPCRSLLVVV